jgi:hypothetical protein
MKINKKKIYCLLVIFFVMLLGFSVWLSLRTVEIVAVHKRTSGFSDVLVTKFPFTTRGKINWWLENKEMLKNKYNIPQSEFSKNFTITFWLFGEGYMEQGKYDRLCFPEMKTEKNCIEKEKVFTVDYSKNTGLFFTVSGGYYRLKDNGKIEKTKIY